MRMRQWWRQGRLMRRSERGPLRVAFLVTSLPVGGAETLLVNLLNRIDPRRFRCEVICLKEAGPLGESMSDRIPVHCDLLRRKWDLRVLPKLIGLYRHRYIDAVITVGAGDKMFWGRLAAWLAGIPVIGSALHSTGWPDGVGRLNRLLTPLTDAFIAVANRHGEFMRQVERFPADRVHIIRNGIDTCRFQASQTARVEVREELGLPKSAPLVGIVAALRPEKNHRMFVEVARRVVAERADVHFLVVGDGPERQSIDRLRNELQLADRVHLLGTRHDTERILAALDLFLLTSDNEASPVSILEALACEVPVVSTDVGSIGESVTEGETGYLVPTGDVAGMAEHAVRLLRIADLRQQLGRAGRQRVLASGSLDAMVEGYEQLISAKYDEAVRGDRQAGRQTLEERLPGNAS